MYCLAVGARKCSDLYVLMGLLELMILYSSPTASQNSGWGRRLTVVRIPKLQALHSPSGANLYVFPGAVLGESHRQMDRIASMPLLVTQMCIA